MRKELEDFDWHFYGLTVKTFDYILGVVENTVDDRLSLLPHKIGSIEVIDEQGNQVTESEDAIEAIGEYASDLAYYTELETYVLYEFGLWRLQGIFEGILKQEFFPTQNLTGLKKKLDYVRRLGYKISQTDYDELLKWAGLRNALSHFPPAKYDSSMLGADDLKEYLGLAKKVVQDLEAQKGTISIPLE